MKNKKYLFGYLLVAIALGTAWVTVKCVNTDLWGVGGLGSGIFYNKDVARIDKDGNLRLYNGNIIMGDIGTNVTATQLAETSGYPSTINGYYGVKVPFFNASTTATALGSVIVAAGTSASAVSSCTMVTTLATTTVVGVSDGIYPAQTVGYMTISGYALVLTTGTVMPGNVLVSTDGTNAAGAAGLAGATTGTQVVGTGIGKAVAKGTSAGGLTLAIIQPE